MLFGNHRHLDLFYNAMAVQDGWLGMVNMRDISVLKMCEAELTYAAIHDARAGQANRTGMDKRLDLLLSADPRRRRGLALMVFDLDKFKKVNDTLGHIVGHEGLEKVARRATGQWQKADFVVRLGGDEFVVILASPVSPDIARDVAARLVKTLAQPMQIGSEIVQIGVSIAIKMADASADNATDLIHAADEALYQVKRQGRNGYAFARETEVRDVEASIKHV